VIIRSNVLARRISIALRSPCCAQAQCGHRASLSLLRSRPGRTSMYARATHVSHPWPPLRRMRLTHGAFGQSVPAFQQGLLTCVMRRYSCRLSLTQRRAEQWRLYLITCRISRRWRRKVTIKNDCDGSNRSQISSESVLYCPNCAHAKDYGARPAGMGAEFRLRQGF
jgi:hypothetical protein